MATATKSNKAEFLKASTPAEAARVLGHEDGGKKLRARLRTLGGKQADNPTRLAEHAEELWAIFEEGKKIVKAKTEAKAPKKSSKRKVSASAE